jgi:hypothetical protein
VARRAGGRGRGRKRRRRGRRKRRKRTIGCDQHDGTVSAL